MHPDEIYAHIRRQPFHPLRVHVTDGATFEIRHPEFALLTMTNLHIALPQDLGGIPERSVYIAPEHVTHIEPLEVSHHSVQSEK